MPSSSVSYRTLFSLPGGTFVAVSALARLPLAMSQLGTLLLVSSPQVSGRLGPGGLAAGVVALAIAIGSPFFGALTDRHGQRVVLLAQSLVGGTALIAEGLAAVMGAAWPVVAVMGGLAGFFLPQIGTMARVRWRAMGAANPTMEAGILETSFAWEGAIDEASFALGPAAVGALAVLAGPVPGLIVAGAMLVVLGSWFALDPTSKLVEVHPGRTIRAGPGTVRSWWPRPAIHLRCRGHLRWHDLYGHGVWVCADRHDQPRHRRRTSRPGRAVPRLAFSG